MLVLETSTPSINDDIKTVESVKKVVKTVLVMIGPHSSVFYKDMLKKNVDIVALGEYDYTLLDIAKRIKSGRNFKGVKGIAWKDKKGRIILEDKRPLIKNLDNLPFPARELFNLDYYDHFPGREKGNITMITSRGCPYRCTYCLWPQVMYGHEVRLRSPKNVVAEMKEVIEKYGATNIFFDDDMLTHDKKRTVELCNEIINSGIKVNWQCYGRVNIADLEMFKKMKEAGCVMVRFGIESGVQEILNNVKKGVTLEQIKNAFSLAKKAGLKTFGTVMFGLPGENKETVKKTVKFLIELEPDYVQFSIVTPYPGTELYDYLKKNGYLITTEWSEYNGSFNAVFELPTITRSELNDAIKYGWRKFYLRPEKIIKELLRIRNIDHVKRIGRGVKTILRGHF